jgi:hypothetical protein
MKKQRGGDYYPYDNREKNQLRRIGFTNEQIQLLNRVKIKYGPDSINAWGLLYVIEEGFTTPESVISHVKNFYLSDGDTDIEEDTDYESEQDGGKKMTLRKSRAKYSTKRSKRSKTMRRTRRRRRQVR